MCCDHLATIITLFLLFILLILSVKEIHVLIKIICGGLFWHGLYGRNKHFFFFSLLFFFFFTSLYYYFQMFLLYFHYVFCHLIYEKSLQWWESKKVHLLSYIYLITLVSMFSIWLMLNNQLYYNSVIRKVIDPPAERVTPPSSTFTSYQ